MSEASRDIPIMWNHRPDMPPVGRIEGDVASIRTGFVPVGAAWDLGLEIMETETLEGVEYITKARILLLSVIAPQAPNPQNEPTGGDHGHD